MDAGLAEVDVGLGTAYERVAIYRLLERWTAGRRVRTAFEGPIDGMAGVPGLHLVGLAHAGAHVTVALTDAPALARVRSAYRAGGIEDRLTTRLVESPLQALDGTYDLVLAYNALPLAGDRWRTFLEQVARLAQRFLVVSVTNPWSYGVWMRRALRHVDAAGRRGEELFDHDSTRAAVLEPELARIGRTLAREYLDCPWWPDLFVPTGETLLSGTIGRMPLVGRAVPHVQAQPPRGAGYVVAPEAIPRWSGAELPDPLRSALRRHPVFDERGELLGLAFGHHRAYLLETARGA